jgi:homoserine dehydrogenase
VEALQRNGDLLARRAGARLVLRKVADLDLDRDRGVALDRKLLTRDAEAVIADPSVDVVVELVGGLGVARKFILRALELGKPVVTANKALLAEQGDELFAAAGKHHAELCFEASVGGGIPILRALREGLIANQIESLHAILNGTCNYILTRMEEERLPFDPVLKAAQAEGFAEADPGLDIDGIDTAHKAVILARLAYGFPVAMKDVHVEGIRGLSGMDIAYAAELGYRVKLLAVIRRTPEGVQARVHPALVDVHHMLAKVSGVFNAIMVKGDVVGDTLYYGRGAGRSPTASAVLSDLADLARHRAAGAAARPPAFAIHDPHGQVRNIDDSSLRCYQRLTLLDRPGVLARVADILGRHRISIASLLQKEARAGEHVPVVIVSHNAPERSYREAQREIDALDSVGAPTVRIRIEDF